MTGESTASIGLNFGADDLDGTIGEERIAHAALAASPLGIARDRMVDLIRDAGKVPVERDAPTASSGSMKPRIGRIPYLNTEPFFR